MRSPIPDYLDELLEHLRDRDSGAVADYIPPLAEADPSSFALAVTTASGSTYAAGDAEEEFTIQSISKPFAYAAALLDRGVETVLAAVDVEPSGEAFNELSLDGETKRPKNPMINAGAITVHSLLVGHEASEAQRVERVRSFFSALAGRELAIDERVAASELAGAHRNFAIGHMLTTYGSLSGDVHQIVEGYIRQCSILVTVRDLSMMAATLATGGIQPVTGERLMSARITRQVMAVMASSGMYDDAGDWLTQVGIPAKSGVAGGMVGVLPDQVGIGAFSPRLDSHGNSVRGRQAFEHLSEAMGMHLFSADRGRLDAVRRREAEDGTVTFALQGNVQFTASAELLDLMRELPAGECRVGLDVSRVHSFSSVGRRMTLEGLRRLRLDGHEVTLHDPDGVLPQPDLGDGSYPLLKL